MSNCFQEASSCLFFNLSNRDFCVLRGLVINIPMVFLDLLYRTSEKSFDKEVFQKIRRIGGLKIMATTLPNVAPVDFLRCGQAGWCCR